MLLAVKVGAAAYPVSKMAPDSQNAHLGSEPKPMDGGMVGKGTDTMDIA